MLIFYENPPGISHSYGKNHFVCTYVLTKWSIIQFAKCSITGGYLLNHPPLQEQEKHKLAGGE